MPNHADSGTDGVGTVPRVHVLPFHVTVRITELEKEPLVVSPTAVHDVGLMQLIPRGRSSEPLGGAGRSTSDQLPSDHCSVKPFVAEPFSAKPVAMQKPAPAHETA